MRIGPNLQLNVASAHTIALHLCKDNSSEQPSLFWVNPPHTSSCCEGHTIGEGVCDCAASVQRSDAPTAKPTTIARIPAAHHWRPGCSILIT
jgi:hypothetical protein